MPADGHSRETFPKRFKTEMREYALNASYFAIFLLSLTTYRKLVMAEYGIDYEAFGWAILQAMILGKVVLIGQFLRLGTRFENRPLILAALWKSFVFALLTVGLVVLEHVVKALWHHRAVGAEFDFSGGRADEALARMQLMLVAFVPFFAFREVGRVLGPGKLGDLLFHGRPR